MEAIHCSYLSDCSLFNPAQYGINQTPRKNLFFFPILILIITTLRFLLFHTALFSLFPPLFLSLSRSLLLWSFCSFHRVLPPQIPPHISSSVGVLYFHCFLRFFSTQDPKFPLYRIRGWYKLMRQVIRSIQFFHGKETLS